ncbi:MAG: hypothetical protein GY946_06640 [bacterium]|nr:hypothetical protein [bacterium]
MHARTVLLVLTASLSMIAPGVDARSAPDESAAVTAKQRDKAIAQGLRYLDETVLALPDASGTPRKPFTVSVTGLCWLLAEDAQSRTARGFGSQIKRARKYLRTYLASTAKRAADESQWPEKSGSFSSNDLIQYTWPFAMSAVFFGELHARGQGGSAARKQLRVILPVLEAAQAPGGGWGHGKTRTQGTAKGPNKMDGFGAYPDTLVSSSNIVALSLAAVQKIAPLADKETLPRALAYFRYAQLDNGNFPYDPSQRSSGRAMTGVSRAAGSILALRYLGVPWKDEDLAQALAFIDDNFEYLSEGHGSSAYNLMLAALLQKARGPKEWKRFREIFFRRIVDGQQENGSFLCICEGKAFASTNDSRPMGGKVKTAGMPGVFADGRDAYVSAIHTLILLLDKTQPKLIPVGKDVPRVAAPITPR